MKAIPASFIVMIFALLVLMPEPVSAQSLSEAMRMQANNFDEDYEAKQWEEIAVHLPPPPKKENLIAIYVSAATEHRFLVDPDSISLGKDGVARYTLVIQTSGGATNVSYEGMRCETRERRSYAFGRSDGIWSKSRGNAWVKIREETTNRHHAALFTDFLCPGGVMAGSVDNVRFALRNQSGVSPFGSQR